MPSALEQIFSQLKHRYPLLLTHASAVDDGFTDDFPVLVGRNDAAAFWLYDDGDMLVFSAEIPGEAQHAHWHPQTMDEAVQDVIDFMEGLPARERSSL